MLPTYLKREDGSIYINPAKRHVRSFWLTSEGPGATPQAVVVPANGTTVINFPVDTQGHFEIAYAMFNSTDPNLLIEIKDPGTRRSLMNRAVPIGAVAGTAQNPFIWPETYFMNTNDGPRSLRIEFTDLSGAPNTVRFVLHGRRFYHTEAPPDVQMKMIEHFARKERTNVYFLYPLNGDIVLAANQSLLGQNAAPVFEATDEADTEIMQMASTQTGAFEFRLVEQRSNRALMNEFVHNTLGFGTGAFPFILQESLLLERNYDLSMEITDLSGNPNTVRPVLIGRRLYLR